MPVVIKEKTKVTDKRPVIGLDVSTRTGFVMLHLGAVVAEEIVLKPAENAMGRALRSLEFAEQLHNRLIKYTPQLVVFEGYSFGSQYNSVPIELGAIARYVCVKLAVPIVEVSPTSLKKFIIGIGKGDKNVVMMHVLKKWGFEPATDNIADAYGLAKMGLCLAGLDKPLAYENMVLQSLGQKKAKKKGKKQP